MVTVPDPVLVSAPLPVKLALMLPACTLNAVPDRLPPPVPLMVPLDSVTVPADRLSAPTSNVPPLTLTALPDGKATALLNCSSPKAALMPPLKVLVPLRLSTPVPCLVKEPVPPSELTTPLVPATLQVLVPVSWLLPLINRVPAVMLLLANACAPVPPPRVSDTVPVASSVLFTATRPVPLAPPLAGSLATSTRLAVPLCRRMGWLMSMLLPAFRVSDRPELEVMAASTAMLLVACSKTGLVRSCCSTAVAVMTLLTPPAANASVGVLRSSPVVASPLTSAGPPLMVRLVGSSNRLPDRPAGAWRSTLPRKSRYCLPDTSTCPPSPPAAPPRAAIWPW